jgi:hypothetical protein
MKRIMIFASLLLLFPHQGFAAHNSDLNGKLFDICVCAVSIIATEMINESQRAELRKDIRQHPEVKDIYKDGLKDVEHAAQLTRSLNFMTGAGLIICRLAGMDPYLTCISAILSAVSTIPVRNKRIEIQEEAEDALHDSSKSFDYRK